VHGAVPSAVKRDWSEVEDPNHKRENTTESGRLFFFFLNKTAVVNNQAKVSSITIVSRRFTYDNPSFGCMPFILVG